MVETTWPVRYPWPVEITYDPGGECLGHEFKIFFIENKYGIKTKPNSSGNPQDNSIIYIINQVLGNIVQTYNLQGKYVDDTDLSMGILVAAAFVVRSTYHSTKGKIPCQIDLGRGMILSIYHVADWRYIHKRKQAQINKDVIRGNTTRIDHDYRVGDKSVTINNSAYKYKTPFKVPYEIFQMWTRVAVTLITVTVTHGINIRNIKPYNNTDVE